jgi:hypothetical protein
MPRTLLVLPAALLVLAAAGCSGGSNAASTPAGGTASSGTPAQTVTAAASTPVPDGTPFTADQAAALLDSFLLKPADLPQPALGWKVASDTSADNAASVAADPTSAASNTRCGRLLARTITNQPDNLVGAFIAGQTVSFFSTATVYAQPSGAKNCADEQTQNYSKDPQSLVKAFGSLFMDPAAVTVAPVTFPTIGDGSAAFTLAGKVNASGTIVDLTLLVVAFREGAVNAVVGSAANAAPSTDELTPLVGLVLRRIAAAEGR